MPQQLLGARPVFGFHENAAHEVPRLHRDVRGQQRVGGLGGNLEYGGHGFVFSPGGLLGQHLHHRAAQAPARITRSSGTRSQHLLFPNLGSLQVLPNVGLPAVALSADHLRTHPVGGAGHGADAGARHADGLEPLTGAEISEFHVARRVPEDVGAWDAEFPQISGGSHGPWENISTPPSPTFDVPVDDHVAVQVGHAFQDLPRVLPGHVFRQGAVGLQLVFDGTLERKQLSGQSPSG